MGRPLRFMSYFVVFFYYFIFHVTKGMKYGGCVLWRSGALRAVPWLRPGQDTTSRASNFNKIRSTILNPFNNAIALKHSHFYSVLYCSKHFWRLGDRVRIISINTNMWLANFTPILQNCLRKIESNICWRYMYLIQNTNQIKWNDDEQHNIISEYSFSRLNSKKDVVNIRVLMTLFLNQHTKQ